MTRSKYHQLEVGIDPGTKADLAYHPTEICSSSGLHWKPQGGAGSLGNLRPMSIV